MKKLLLLAAGSALLLGGCASNMGADADMSGDATMTNDGGMAGDAGMAGDPAGAAMAGDMTPEERTAFVKMAASSDMFEIESSRLALTRSQDPEVKQFAQMMVSDHTRMSQQLMAAAQAAGVPPMTPAMLPPHADMLARLQGQSGPGFDAAYAEAQVIAHKMAIALHGNYARNGDTAALKAVAATAVPVIQQHLQTAQRLP